MDRKIRVGAVSYLNTKPLIYGLEKGMMKDELELVLDFPANIANMLLNDEIDMGLVPVAILPEMKEYHIVSDFGISSDGPVASVCLFSEVPIEEVKEVLLDYQSRTSVQLARILLKEYWKVDPVLTATNAELGLNVAGQTAAVIIGDRALAKRKNSAFVYDLGEAWKAFTNLPFVYAAWISNKLISENFIRSFNKANAFGVDRIEEVIANNPYPEYDLNTYYTRNIGYILNNEKKVGLNFFLGKL